MWFGVGINWWVRGAADPTPPVPGDFWCARTGDSSMCGGQIDLRNWFIFFVTGVLTLC
jgi:hypothetical protein